MRSPKSGLTPIGAAEKLAIVHDPEAEAVFDADDQEIVEAAAVAEPVLGERHQVDVAVDRHRHAETRRHLGPEIGTSRSRKIGLWRQRPAARSMTPGRPTQTPLTARSSQPGIGDRSAGRRPRPNRR